MLPQFASTLNSGRSRFLGIKPNIVNVSDFMSVLFGQPPRKLKQPKFKIDDLVRISKVDLPFKKTNKPQFTEVFEIVAIVHKKPSTYTNKAEQSLIIRGKFFEKELSRVI